MTQMNYLVLFLSAFIPMLVGFIWYNPKVFGSAWMKLVGIVAENIDQKAMNKVFLLTFILSFMYAIGLQFVVIHQNHVQSILLNEVGFATQEGDAWRSYQVFMEKFGNNFRTFGHGALHGFVFSVFMLLPVIAVNAMFELKSWKLIWINWGFWAVCSILMGGVICKFA